MSIFKKMIVFSFTVIPLFVFSQEKVVSDSLRKDALNLYIQCGWCDYDYIREEINFVNFVREPKEAQVYLLVTSQPTGSGGEQYSLFFIGQQKFNNKTDTLYFTVSADDTEDIIRDKMLKTIQAGLIRFVAQTPLIDKISIEYSGGDNKEEVEDKWKSWVFKLSTSGNSSIEKSYQSFYVYSTIDVEKVTEKFKTEFYFSNSYSESRYKLDNLNFTSISRSYGFSNTTVKSLNDHWSAGFYTNMSSSTYRNINFGFSIDPTIEYNLFPYSEASRRQCRFQYKIGSRFNQYEDSTIYNKIEESLYKQSLGIAYSTIQKWGSVNASIGGSNYLHDFSKNNLYIYLSTSWRIVKGLSFYTSSSFSIVHDQLSLPKYDATPEEVLLQQRELESQYDFYFYCGFSYTFGSIYNNVVNPRFGD